MSDKEPPSWFDKAGTPDPKQAEEERQRSATLTQQLPELLKQVSKRSRADQFYPYLLIRSLLGDRGDRPYNVPYWESPDIWTALGEPSDTPAVPPHHGGAVMAGRPQTVYAHVWNLGFAPIAGVNLEFYWSPPWMNDAGPRPPQVNLIGRARTDLAGRGSAESHKLVKCPTAWSPVGQGDECLFARASSVGDPIGNNDWHPFQNRHVAQRNVTVVQAGTDVGRLVNSLNLSRPSGARVQLVQVGATEGALAVRLVAPTLHIAPAVTTHLLGELSDTGQVTLPAITEASPAMLAPVHALAHGITSTRPTLAGSPRLVDSQALLAGLRPAASSVTAVGGIHDLLAAVERFHSGARIVDPPGEGEAYVLRLVSYQAQQLVGGYTLIVGGHA